MSYRGYQRLNLNVIWLIIGLNVLIFLATSVSGRLTHLLGLQPDLILERPWTILTSMFVHASFWHILGNMVTLYFFGMYVYRLVGEGKFLLAYFAGGILGNILFVLLAPPLSIAIGASGAIFALGGVLVTMRPNVKVFLYFVVPMPLWVAVIGGFLLLSFMPGVAWAAHLGGLAFGLAAGYLFRKRGRYYYY